MGQTIFAARDKTNVPLNLLVQRDGGITGLTVDIKIFNGNNLSQFLDFADGVFKDAAHGTPTLNLPAIQATEFPGMYSVDTGFDLSAITVPAAAASLLVRYEITAGGESGEDFDTILFTDRLVDDVWDEVNRGADHNIKDSTGKQQRQASGGFESQDVASLGGASTVELDPSESSIDDFIVHRYIAITDGTGAGQGRIISAYNGTTKVATVSRPWDVIPDATSDYLLLLGLGDTFVTDDGIDAAALATGALQAIADHLETLGTNPHGTGSWAGLATAPQVIRDAMKLAPTGGAPAAGSVDEHLDEILTDTAAIDLRLPADPADESLQQAAHTATQAAVALNETEVSAAAREVTNTAEHALTQSTGGPGPWTTFAGGGGLTAQQTRDAMKLAPTVGAPAAGSVDEHLDEINADTDSLDTTKITPARAANLDEITAARLAELDAANLPSDVDDILADTSVGGAGPWTTGSGLTPQQARDAMKLAPTGGAPAAGSVDEHLDDILADTAAGGAGPWATATGFETEVSAAARAVTNQAEHDATQAAVALVETEAAAATREGTNTTEHAATLTAVGLNETEVAAAARAVSDAAAHALTQSTGGPGPWTTGAGVGPQAIRDAMKLAPTVGAPAAGSVDEHLDEINADTAAIEPLVTANLDATITSRESEAAASARAATAAAAHAALSVEHTALGVGIAAGETEVAAAAREATNTGEHTATLTAVGLNESEADAATRAAVVTKLRKETTNRTELDLVTQEEHAYDDNGTTIIQTWDIETDGGEPATTQLGVITKRGPPKL